MCYKSIVNELDDFLTRKKKNSCYGCPIGKLASSVFSFDDKLEEEFNIHSSCVIRFFYNIKIKEALPEDKINFLLEKLKEDNIQYINCDNYKNALPFLKVLKSIIHDELEIE
jgi:hypothetical protein